MNAEAGPLERAIEWLMSLPAESGTSNLDAMRDNDAERVTESREVLDDDRHGNRDR